MKLRRRIWPAAAALLTVILTMTLILGLAKLAGLPELFSTRTIRAVPPLTTLLTNWSMTTPDRPAAPPLPVFESPELTPVWRTPSELRGPPSSAFPAFSLTDQAGRSVTRTDLQGRVVVAHFFFTHCSNICPTLISAMGRVRDAYAGQRGVLLLSHSVTPDYDTPVMLNAYAQTNRIDGQQWRLLTGSNEEISRVAHDGYFVPRSAVSAQGVIHTELFVLLDGQQRVRGVYNGTLRPEMAQLISDVKTLLVAEASP